VAIPGVAGWQQQILKGVGAPTTPENLRFLDAWQRAEGGSAANNPFNTTEPMPGASSYNSVGVRNYQTPQQGLAATIQTLKGPIGNYGPILDALRQGKDARAAAQAVANSQWGTGAGVLKVLGGGPATSPATATSTVPIPLKNTATPSVVPKTPSLSVPSQAQPNIGAALFGLGMFSPPQNPGDALSNLVGAVSMARTTAPPAAAPSNAAAPPVDQATGAHGQNVTFHVEGKQDARTGEAIDLAKQYLGTPYVWGGAHPGGFDCSGLLQYVWGKAGVQIPRTTYDQIKAGTPVAKNALQPGDAVFFTGSDPMNGLPGHVGMYIGQGKFIEAPHTGANVRISNIAGRSDFAGARRFG
jgi:cell wall-associated NlpC family hydrolase